MNDKYRMFFENLKLTIVSLCVFTLIGFLLSSAIAGPLYPDVMAYKMDKYRGIDTRRLEAFEKIQHSVILFSVLIGGVAAQIVFVLSYRKEESNKALNHNVGPGGSTSS